MGLVNGLRLFYILQVIECSVANLLVLCHGNLDVVYDELQLKEK